MSISKIEEINKKFTKKFDYECLTERPNWGDSLGEKIREFYTQQILSLIEELEGKLPKGKPHKGWCNLITCTLDKSVECDCGSEQFNSAIDQMRASIKSFLK